MVLVLLLVFIVAVGGSLLAYLYFRATQLPSNNPKKFNRNSKPTIVCIGDSITHASVSANYVDMVSHRLLVDGESFNIVNAGINSDLTYTVLQRLDEIIGCQPTLVTILLGGNDLNADYFPITLKGYLKEGKIAHDFCPGVDGYGERLVLIIQTLIERIPNVKIGLVSLPPYGERKSGEEYLLWERYLKKMSTVAEIYIDVEYLPAGEAISERLIKKSAKHKEFDYRIIEKLMYKAIFLRYILKNSWDEISRRNGLSATTDLLHMNDQAAGIVSDYVYDFIKENSTGD